MRRRSARSLGAYRIYSSAAAGLIWGLVAMAVNSLTGVFAFDSGLAHNLVSFILGGVLFALVSGGLLYLLDAYLPFRGYTGKALVVTTALWLLFRGVGVLLSVMDPIRYYVMTAESLQGLALAVVLGAILGVLWSMAPSGDAVG